MATTADTYPTTGTNATHNVGTGNHLGTGTGTGLGHAGAGTGMTEKGAVGARTGTTDTKYKYHPALFAALLVFSIIELGLTAYLIRRGGLFRLFRSATIFLLFTSVWSTLGSLLFLIFISSNARHMGASKGAAVGWLTITAILWGIASGLYTRSRPGFGDRRSIAAEAFGWIPFVTTVLTLLATVHRAGRVASSPTGGGYRSGYYV